MNVYMILTLFLQGTVPPPLTPSLQLFIINYPLSIIHYQLSIIHYQLSIFYFMTLGKILIRKLKWV